MESHGNADVLDANEVKRLGLRSLHLEAEANRLRDTVHEFVERPGLGVTTAERWDGGDIVVLPVSLDYTLNSRCMIRLREG